MDAKKENVITKTDPPEQDSQKVFSVLGAFNLKNWLVTNYTTLMNNIRGPLEAKISTKLSHGGHSGTAQTLLELINSKINKSNISNSVSSTSTANVASSQAVKTAYDKGVEVVNKVNSKWDNNNCPISKNTSGYCKLANGLIIQWGSISNSPNQPRNAYSFPIAFTSTNYKILITESTTSSTYWTGKANVFRAISTSQLALVSWDDGGVWQWMVIGY